MVSYNATANLEKNVPNDSVLEIVLVLHMVSETNVYNYKVGDKAFHVEDLVLEVSDVREDGKMVFILSHKNIIAFKVADGEVLVLKTLPDFEGKNLNIDIPV